MTPHNVLGATGQYSPVASPNGGSIVGRGHRPRETTEDWKPEAATVKETPQDAPTNGV